MPYRPVQRIVTVEFVQAPSGSGYDVRVTPERFTARCGDTIVWDIQGLNQSRAQKLTVGNFKQTVAYPVVAVIANRLTPARPQPIIASKAVSRNSRRHYQTKVELRRATPGLYKYDIEWNGKAVIDPEGEVRGPKY